MEDSYQSHTPLVDFPQAQVLDPLNLFNRVIRQCTVEEVPHLLVLF